MANEEVGPAVKKPSFAQALLQSLRPKKVSIQIKLPTFTDAGAPAVFFSEEKIMKSEETLKRAIIPPVKTFKMVRWIPPLHGLLLNVDGASKGNPGPCGGGGIVRNTVGTMVLAFSHFYGVGTSLLDEVRAMCDGVQLALEKGFYLAEISTDSMVLVNSLRTGIAPSWECYRWWRIVLDFVQQYQVRIMHVYREANQVNCASALVASTNSYHAQGHFLTEMLQVVACLHPI
ncbi:hypothetical protein Taro_023135 [Colocasia esculenta]|uniref:RNase H type-1 domain-containing protein n=1 Tax=Colocasia esculenta TaxID=4460 RepID=A0A843VAH1_COLES|nr:hypothetical protein [Colocasia esculenta]